VGLERVERPGDGGRVARCAGETRADLGGERADEFVGRVVGERALAEGAGFGEDGGGEGGGGRGCGAAGGGGRGGRDCCDGGEGQQ
jgi:hypothetical protein